MLSLAEYLRMVGTSGDDAAGAYEVVVTVELGRTTVSLQETGGNHGAAPVKFSVKEGSVVDAKAIHDSAVFLNSVGMVDRAAELATWMHTMERGEVPAALEKQDFELHASQAEIDGKPAAEAVITEDGKERARLEAGSSLGRHNQVWRRVTAGWEARRRMGDPDGGRAAPPSQTAMSAVAQAPELTDQAVETLVGRLAEPLATTQKKAKLRQMERMCNAVVAELGRGGVAEGNSSLTRSWLVDFCDQHGFVFSEIRNPPGQEGEPSAFVMHGGEGADPTVITGDLHVGTGGERMLPPIGVFYLLADIGKLIREGTAELRQQIQAAAPDAESMASMVHEAAEQHLEEHPEELREAKRIEREGTPGPDGDGPG